MNRLPLSWRIALRRAPAIAAWALTKKKPKTASFELVVCARETPLRRSASWHAPEMQQGKETNVALAATALDGVVIAPGATFSWHAVIGPPLGWRGFVPGPELRHGALAAGVGGGVCQVANLLYWLALHAGLDVTERHRHGFDLFPDDARDVPFGLGATVFYPHRDLRVRNPHDVPVALSFAVVGGELRGAVTTRERLPHAYRVLEREHRIVEDGDGHVRSNVIVRETLDGGEVIATEIVARNSARLMYEPTPERMASCFSA